MTDGNHHSRLQPLAVIAAITLAGLVLLTSPQRQSATEHTGTPTVGAVWNIE